MCVCFSVFFLGEFSQNTCLNWLFHDELVHEHLVHPVPSSSNVGPLPLRLPSCGRAWHPVAGTGLELRSPACGRAVQAEQVGCPFLLTGKVGSTMFRDCFAT